MSRAVTFAIKAILSAVLLFVAIDWTRIGILGDRLRNIHLGWAALMVLAQVIQIVLGGLRWREIVALCERSISRERTVRFSFIAAFFNQTLPSSVGGDAVRVWLLARQGAGWSAATYSVVIDRMIGLMVLALIVIACLPWTWTLISNPVGRAALVLIGFGSFGACVAFIALGYVRLALLQRWRLTRHLVAAAAAAGRLITSGEVTLKVLAISIALHLLTAFAAWCGAKAVAVPFDFTYSVFLVLPVVLVTVVPISIAGWGLRESAMTVAFAYAGLSQSDGLLVSLLYGFGLFVVGAIGGLIWIASATRRESQTLRATIDAQGEPG